MTESSVRLRALKRRMLRRFRWLYAVRVVQLQFWRWLHNLCSGTSFARGYAAELAQVCCRHQSLLYRRLGDSDPQLQINKVVNLRLAALALDGLIIPPGTTFSFWDRIGRPSAARGYLEGLQLSQGEVVRGIGGGLCQMANLLYWMALHTPLQVVERHHHSFDPFPDDHRTLPFGSGAGVFYNYVDLRFHHPTRQSFQLRVWLTDKHLKGLIRSDLPWPFTYSVFERNHRFQYLAGVYYRGNEIWRRVVCRDTGAAVSEEILMRNWALVKYPLTAEQQAEAHCPTPPQALA